MSVIELHKKLQKISEKNLYRPWTLYNTPEERVNELWKLPDFWQVPDRMMKVEKKNKYEGTYQICSGVVANEHFYDGIESEAQKAARQNGKERLKEKLYETRSDLDIISERYMRLLSSRVPYIIRFIESKAMQVTEYEPFGDRATEQTIEAIENAELAFYGSVYGSEFAINNLLPEYVDDSFHVRREHKKLLIVAREYFVLQITLRHYEQLRKRRETPDNVTKRRMMEDSERLKEKKEGAIQEAVKLIENGEDYLTTYGNISDTFAAKVGRKIGHNKPGTIKSWLQKAHQKKKLTSG